MFSVCCTELGRFSFCGSINNKQPEIEKELGIGILIYFRTLKFLCGLYTVFTILSIPLFIVYFGTNNNGVDLDFDLKSICSEITLGNIG
jgi:hypothetical protein